MTQQRGIASCNAAFLELFGYESGELLGQSIVMLYPSPRESRHIGKRGYEQMEADGRHRDKRLMLREHGVRSTAQLPALVA